MARTNKLYILFAKQEKTWTFWCNYIINPWIWSTSGWVFPNPRQFIIDQPIGFTSQRSLELGSKKVIASTLGEIRLRFKRFFCPGLGPGFKFLDVLSPKEYMYYTYIYIYIYSRVIANTSPNDTCLFFNFPKHQQTIFQFSVPTYSLEANSP